MLKERVKSLALFLLFALSIYLMKELWASDLILMLNDDTQKSDTYLNTTTIIAPRSITYGFGSGVYSVVFFDKYDTWEAFSASLTGFLDQSFKLEAIDQSVYEEAKKARFIEVKLPYAITIRDLAEFVDSDSEKKSTDGQVIEDLLYVSGKNNSLYLHENGAYYILKGQGVFSNLEQERMEAENNEIKRFKTVEGIYKIRNILTTESQVVYENKQLLPVGKASNLPRIHVIPEYNIVDDGVLRGLVTQFFGTHIVKKLVDIDGSLVYLYGYGEKTLKVSLNGSIEFKSKIQNVPLKAISLFEALNIAMNYIDRFGGVPENLTLAEYTFSLEDDIPVYRFYFSLGVSHLNVVAETMNPGIQMTLVGEQITEYNRFILVPIKEIPVEPVTSNAQTVDFLINSNFEEVISPNFLGDHPELLESPIQEGSRNVLYRILQGMDGFEPLYYFDESDDQALIPVWKIGFDQYLYYFDLNTGQILKTERKGESDGLVQN